MCCRLVYVSPLNTINAINICENFNSAEYMYYNSEFLTFSILTNERSGTSGNARISPKMLILLHRNCWNPDAFRGSAPWTPNRSPKMSPLDPTHKGRLNKLFKCQILQNIFCTFNLYSQTAKFVLCLVQVVAQIYRRCKY